MARILPLAAALCALLTAPWPAGAAELAPDAVLVVGPIHRLHASDPDFSYAHLRQILDAARPDILVVETRDDELAERKDTPGRPEYPAVVWPWLARKPVIAVHMEPSGETFAAMTGAAGARHEAFEAQRPDAARRLARLRRSISAALQAHWRHPADAHDQVTGDLVEALYLAEAALGGPGYDAGQAEWDGYMVARTREIIAAHPGKRVLVLASYRNLRTFSEGLQGEPRLVATEAWLRDNIR